MNKAEEWYNNVLSHLLEYTPHNVESIFAPLWTTGDNSDRSYFKEVFRLYPQYPNYFYPFLACAIRLLKNRPYRQYVEIGADRGASAVMAASEMTEMDGERPGKVYSIDNCSQSHDQTWKYVPEEWKRVVKMNMDSLDIQKLLDVGADLSLTDIWFIDGEHTYNRVKEECRVYMPYWKEGAVIIFDDLSRVQPAFDELPYANKFIEIGHLHGVDEGSGIIVV